MQVDPHTHLTYCTNVHPGERYPEVRSALERYVTAVKAKVAPDAPFGVGLRLSATAALELEQPERLAELQRFLEREQLYVFTLNGFPYGTFHGSIVKEAVYLPDWRDPERLAYSDRLARLLTALLAPEQVGSISTVPGGFRSAVAGEHEVADMANHMLAHIATLHRLREETGKSIALALEPEPACLLETTDEAIEFFDRHLRSEPALAELGQRLGITRGQAADVIARHAGVCVDTCHAAVEFEDPATMLDRLAAAEVAIKKLQLSAGLRIRSVDDEMCAALEPYRDAVYLHQVVERYGDRLVRHVDLDEALAAFSGRGPEWRVHFHVPIFLERMRHFDSTQPFLRQVLARQRSDRLSSHLEVETYTWDVLPDEARPGELTEALARELRFCMSELGLEAPRSW